VVWFLFQKLKLLCVEAGHSQKSPRNFDFCTAHSHNTSALTIICREIWRRGEGFEPPGGFTHRGQQADRCFSQQRPLQILKNKSKNLAVRSIHIRMAVEWD
jgi:hypothetical protein